MNAIQKNKTKTNKIKEEKNKKKQFARAHRIYERKKSM